LFAAHVGDEFVAQHFWGGDGGPDPHRAVAAATGQPVPVGAKRHTPHRIAMTGQRVAEGSSAAVTLDVHADLFYSVLTTVADKLDEAVRKCGQRRPKALVRRPEKVTYLHRRASKHLSLLSGLN